MSSKDVNVDDSFGVAENSDEIITETLENSSETNEINQPEIKINKEKPAKKNSSNKAPKTVLTKYQKEKMWSGYVFIAPLIFGFVFLYGEILLNAVNFSLKEFIFRGSYFELEPFTNGVSKFHNYVVIFTEEKDLVKDLISAVSQMLLDIPLVIFFSLFIATILSHKIPGRGFFRAIFFIPAVLVTGVIIESTMNNAVFTSMQVGDGIQSGGINESFFSMGDLEDMFGQIVFSSNIYGYLQTAVSNIFDVVNKCGVQILIFISALLSISPSLYESAKIEGASGWDCYWKITIPMIGPMIYVNVIYTIVESLVTPTNLIMQRMAAFKSAAQYDLAAATSIVYFIIIAAIIALFSLAMKRVVFYQTND